MCVLCLVQEKILDLYLDVSKYLNSWKIPINKFTQTKTITLAELLSHQAGFYDVEGSFAPYKPETAIPTTIDLLQGTSCCNSEEVHAKYVPQIDFAYSDAGYSIIGQIVEDVTGKTISQIANQYVFGSLELKNTFFWELGKESILFKERALSDCVVGHNYKGDLVEEIRAYYPNAEGAGLWATSSDLAVIALDLLASFNQRNCDNVK